MILSSYIQIIIPERKKKKCILTDGQIRNELQHYIDKCKANGTSTQTVSFRFCRHLLFLLPSLVDVSRAAATKMSHYLKLMASW